MFKYWTKVQLCHSHMHERYFTFSHTPASIYLLKVNNRNTRTKVWHMFKVRFGVFIVNFEHILHLCSSVSIVNFEYVIAGRVTYSRTLTRNFIKQNNQFGSFSVSRKWCQKIWELGISFTYSRVVIKGPLADAVCYVQLTLTFPFSCISESCIKIKIN